MRAEDARPQGPTLPFWVSSGEENEEHEDAMGLFGRDSEPSLRNVPLGPLRKNLADTVEALQQIFTEIAERGGPLPLREAQLSFQVTANGGIQLIGTAQMQTARGITLVFKQ